MKDTKSDWLSEELKREGYNKDRTSAQIAHEQEEASRNWDAGAISNANEHAEQHDNLHSENKVEREEIHGNIKKWYYLASYTTAGVFVVFYISAMVMDFNRAVVNLSYIPLALHLLFQQINLILDKTKYVQRAKLGLLIYLISMTFVSIFGFLTR